MSLFEAIGEISNANMRKTDTGDVRMHGITIGIVAKNYDEKMPGRVCVTIPTRGDGKKGDILQWAKVAMPYVGKDWGYYFQPEVGDQVLLAFERGNIEKAFVIGVIPQNEGNSKSTVVKDCFNEKNTKKRIQTKHGTKIEFFDSDGDTKGQKDKLTISMPDNAHFIEMDNDKKYIILSDKDKKNKIEMQTEKGIISCKCEKKFEIKVGDGITIIANGDTGKVSIDAKSITISSSQSNIEIKATQAITMDAKTTATLKGGTNIGIESKGVLSFKGNIIQNG